MKKGYLQIYTGDGKGKTTASLGLAMRAAGAGLKTLIVQFAKGMEYSEHKTLKRFADDIDFFNYGRRCFIQGGPEAEDIAEAKKGLDHAAEALKSAEYDLVILDEACIAVYFNLFSEEELIDVLKNRNPGTEVVLTGRRATPGLIEMADLVTEMKEIKHYYKDGVQARAGIES